MFKLSGHKRRTLVRLLSTGSHSLGMILYGFLLLSVSSECVALTYVHKRAPDGLEDDTVQNSSTSAKRQCRRQRPNMVQRAGAQPCFCHWERHMMTAPYPSSQLLPDGRTQLLATVRRPIEAPTRSLPRVLPSGSRLFVTTTSW